MEYELDAYDASLEVRTLGLRFVRGLAHITYEACLEYVQIRYREVSGSILLRDYSIHCQYQIAKYAKRT